VGVNEMIWDDEDDKQNGDGGGDGMVSVLGEVSLSDIVKAFGSKNIFVEFQFPSVHLRNHDALTIEISICLEAKSSMDLEGEQLGTGK